MFTYQLRAVQKRLLLNVIEYAIVLREMLAVCCEDDRGNVSALCVVKCSVLEC